MLDDAPRSGDETAGGYLSLILQAVGDVAVERQDPDSMFDGCREALRCCDVLFCQLETPVSTRGAPAPHPTLAVRSHPRGLRAMRNAGFDVASFAGNHALDWGADAFLDTIRHAAENDIELCGVGANIAAAREPVTIQRNGLRIAFLAYSSILPAGYWADDHRPGCTPMRAHTHYHQSEPDQPGTPAVVRTFADRDDLDALLNDIRKARLSSDAVIVSMHWGIHFVEGAIADYQREVAHAAINAGAAMILGHHPHILKGIEMYRGCPIFYSMGNFAIEQPATWDPKLRERAAYKTIHALNPTWDMDALYTLPEETRRTLIVRCHIDSRGVSETAFVPAFIEDGSAPRALDATDERFGLVASYVETLSEGLNSGFRRDGNQVAVRELNA